MQRLDSFRDLSARFQAFYLFKGNHVDASREEILKENGGIHRYLTNGLGHTAAEIQQWKHKLLG